ncbi:MAG: hypothetical protein NVSMB19_19550 [Vulcanimicrobiaceae bacterium]
MSRSHAAFAIGFAAALLGAAEAKAPPPLPSLRHLVFEAATRTAQATQAFDSGEGRDGTGNGNLGTGPQNGIFVASGRRSERIVVDVVAAPDDGGLVADVSEFVGGRTVVPVRCSILRDATIVYDPASNIGDEARLAIGYLARGAVPASVVAGGTTWNHDTTEIGFREHLEYRVVRVVPGVRATFAYDGTRTLTGSSFIAETVRGSVAYDLARLVPQSIEETARASEMRGTRRRTVDRSIDIRLLEDRFTKE